MECRAGGTDQILAHQLAERGALRDPRRLAAQTRLAAENSLPITEAHSSTVALVRRQRVQRERRSPRGWSTARRHVRLLFRPASSPALLDEQRVAAASAAMRLDRVPVRLPLAPRCSTSSVANRQSDSGSRKAVAAFRMPPPQVGAQLQQLVAGPCRPASSARRGPRRRCARSDPARSAPPSSRPRTSTTSGRSRASDSNSRRIAQPASSMLTGVCERPISRRQRGCNRLGVRARRRSVRAGRSAPPPAMRRPISASGQ